MSNLPGQYAGTTRTNRQALASLDGVQYERGVIDSTNAYDGANTSYERELRPGLIMARVTSSKKWVPCKRTTVATGGGATAQAIPVVDARAFKAGETISVGSDTGKTIASVNYSTNTITVSDSSFTFADGEAVICTSLAGSEIPRAILNEFVNLVDPDAIARDKTTGKLVSSGYVATGQVLGDLAACRAATNYLAQIMWDDQQGAT